MIIVTVVIKVDYVDLTMKTEGKDGLNRTMKAMKEQRIMLFFPFQHDGYPWGFKPSKMMSRTHGDG